MEKIENMFFEYRFVKKIGEKFCVSSDSVVKSPKKCYAAEYAEKIIAECADGGKTVEIELNFGYTDGVLEKIGENYEEDSESYAIEASNKQISLYASTERGLIYAVSTLKQLMEKKELFEGVIFDFPDKRVRGYRVFTPGTKETEAFKKMVDMLVYYKYNAVMIEVGGAMEYKRRPEINEEWVKYCAEVNKSPYEAERIQFKTFPKWFKNSIHTNNGGGGFITQEQMKEIVEYCRERQLEVIPEVPSLSHCDYIVRPYREINERKEDTYPDTYCPSNPKSYEILFDILDEVIDVFNPKYVNIGHDEAYTFAKCDKCRHKDPVDLYVNDIVKINNYLKSKNIKTVMWGEKVYGNVYSIGPDGKKIAEGGTGNAERDIPRLAECAGRIPKDVILLQWYWSLCSGKDEKEIVDMGYDMVYGNFQAISLKNYRERIKIVHGGFVSNWGSNEEEYMQRNGQNYSLITTAFAFWNKDYGNETAAFPADKVKTELYERYVSTLGENIITIDHTTAHFVPYKAFYDGYYIVREDWTIGEYIVTYADSSEVRLPVVYGYNIRSSGEDDAGITGIRAAEAVVESYVEPIGASYPYLKGEKIIYRTSYTNPHPEKFIQSIEFKSKSGIEVEFEIVK